MAQCVNSFFQKNPVNPDRSLNTLSVEPRVQLEIGLQTVCQPQPDDVIACSLHVQAVAQSLRLNSQNINAALVPHPAQLVCLRA